MNDARLKNYVQFQARAGAKFDIGDQAFSFWRIDTEQTHRCHSGDNSWWRRLCCCGSFRRRRRFVIGVKNGRARAGDIGTSSHGVKLFS